jgi:hypothetical protein
MSREHMLPVWFFIGILLSIYGIIIFFTALGDWSQPSGAILSQLHPGLWGGIVLMLVGGFYVLRFRPGRKKRGLLYCLFEASQNRTSDRSTDLKLGSEPRKEEL